jgi:hypothetical protein
MTDPAASDPASHQGRWSHRDIPANAAAVPPSQGSPAPAAPRPGGFRAVLAVLTTPLITAGLAAVLLVLSVVAFAVKWLTADFSMPLGPQTLSLSSTVNGFGMQKLSGDLGSDSALSGQYLAFALVTLVLLAVGAVLVLLVPRLRKIGALVVAVGGAVEFVYGLLIAVGVLGMDKSDVLGDDLDSLRSLSPQLAQQMEDAFSFGTSAGPWIAIVVGVLAVALGVLFLIGAPGPLLPPAAVRPVQPGQPGQPGNPGQPFPGGAAPQFPQPDSGEGRWSGDRPQ